MTTILPGRPETLTPDQEAKLKSFWKLLFEVCDGTAVGKFTQTKELKTILDRQTGDELRLAYWQAVKYDNPDALILRFLRARKWDVEKAITMMLTTIHWRSQTMHLEDIVKKGECLEDAGFMHQLRAGKSYIHGRDKENRVVCYVPARLHKPSDQSAESLEQFTVWLMETTRIVHQESADTSCLVFDMTGFSVSNMDYNSVKFMAMCFEAHFPECLGVCLVHNAPWFFQGIWKVIKGWLDPVVASKVHFTSGASGLSKFIDKKDIPKSLGGDENWTYQYVEPVPGENSALINPTPQQIEEKLKLEQVRSMLISDYEGMTLKWIKEEGNRSQEERDRLRGELKANYWMLDKYMRARTFYDRIGMIGEGGKVKL
ncbi:hypothetical protein TWF694_006253 [Orbilia ellipsospora]|uniref:CRAL-TRIO domain-containing protein n=1 Tax=Orbilia ellipsospora TaxID=2528407 RepID=A0AAV9XJZ7_9PEZI